MYVQNARTHTRPDGHVMGTPILFTTRRSCMPLMRLVQTATGAGGSNPLRPNLDFWIFGRKLGDKDTGALVTVLTLSLFKVGMESDSRDLGKLGDVNAQVGVGAWRNPGGPGRRNLDLAVLDESRDRRIA